MRSPSWISSGFFSESWSRSSNDGTQVNQTARPLLRPEEILLLRGRSITFVRGHPPVLGTPVRYFDDPLFAARPAAAAPGRRLVRRALLASLLFALLGLLGAACWRAASVAGKNATPRFGAPAAGSRWGVGK